MAPPRSRTRPSRFRRRHGRSGRAGSSCSTCRRRFIWTAWGDIDAPLARELRAPYFELGRSVIDDPKGATVEWQLPYGAWIRLFRLAGLIVEDLIELRPPEDATTTYEGYADLEWARDFPGEHIWKVRKA